MFLFPCKWINSFTYKHLMQSDPFFYLYHNQCGPSICITVKPYMGSHRATQWWYHSLSTKYNAFLATFEIKCRLFLDYDHSFNDLSVLQWCWMNGTYDWSSEFQPSWFPHGHMITIPKIPYWTSTSNVNGDDTRIILFPGQNKNNIICKGWLEKNILRLDFNTVFCRTQLNLLQFSGK